MQITISKRRLTWAAAAVFVCSIAWLFVAHPYAHPQIRKPTKSDLFAGAVLIVLGIGLQRWTRGKPPIRTFRTLGLFWHLTYDEFADVWHYS
jgi:hypothetical protein